MTRLITASFPLFVIVAAAALVLIFTIIFALHSVLCCVFYDCSRNKLVREEHDEFLLLGVWKIVRGH